MLFAFGFCYTATKIAEIAFGYIWKEKEFWTKRIFKHWVYGGGGGGGRCCAKLFPGLGWVAGLTIQILDSFLSGSRILQVKSAGTWTLTLYLMNQLWYWTWQRPPWRGSSTPSSTRPSTSLMPPSPMRRLCQPYFCQNLAIY